MSKTERERVSGPTAGVSAAGQFRIISCDALQWQPYVGVMGRTLIEQVLSDHYPGGEDADRLWARVIVDHGDWTTFTAISGDVQGTSNAGLIFTDGETVPWDEMVSVEI